MTSRILAGLLIGVCALAQQPGIDQVPRVGVGDQEIR